MALVGLHWKMIGSRRAPVLRFQQAWFGIVQAMQMELAVSGKHRSPDARARHQRGQALDVDGLSASRSLSTAPDRSKTFAGNDHRIFAVCGPEYRASSWPASQTHEFHYHSPVETQTLADASDQRSSMMTLPAFAKHGPNAGTCQQNTTFSIVLQVREIASFIRKKFWCQSFKWSSRHQLRANWTSW